MQNNSTPSDPSGSNHRGDRDLLPLPLIPGVDHYLLLLLNLFEQKDWEEIAFRTGIKKPDKDPQKNIQIQHLNLILRVSKNPLVPEFEDLERIKVELSSLYLKIPPAYWRKEQASNPVLSYLIARIPLHPQDPSRVNTKEEDKPRSLHEQIKLIAGSELVESVELAVSQQPCLHESMQNLGLPVDRVFKGKELRGAGVVVGIIDDGCAFAHANFLQGKGAGTLKSRVLALWDQSRSVSPEDALRGWREPPDFEYGREIRNTVIDRVVNANVTGGGTISEDAVYRYLNYFPGADEVLASHGTHVMDIAAGSGNEPFTPEGVAPAASIIFVQIPPLSIGRPGPALSDAIADGIKYVFAEAKTLGLPAVINLSYGGNRGPHNETWSWCAQVDQLLNVPDRAVVVSAGNAFEQNIHAYESIRRGGKKALGWLLKPEDPTSNDVEIWYSGDAELAITLIAPGGETHGPYGPGSVAFVRSSDDRIIGHIFHYDGGSDKTALVTLRATGTKATATHAPASAGRWQIILDNTTKARAEVHAWIQRDDVGPLGARRQQSSFEPDVARPTSTICDYATGRKTISVGAFKIVSDEVSRYSACGPTRPSGVIPVYAKPDTYAPAEEDEAGFGILSASSRRATPTRLNGTSAAAPHVTGLVALAMEYAVYVEKSLTSEQIRDAIIAGAEKTTLEYDRHQAIDDSIRIKQKDVWKNLAKNGRIEFLQTMDDLFPYP